MTEMRTVANQALTMRPNAPEATLLVVEDEVAHARNFSTAHDQLLASLRANPTNSAVWEYLSHLDSLVLKKDPATELGAMPEPPDEAAMRKAALDDANRARAGVGVAALKPDSDLDQAALAHAFYYLFNFD